MRNLSSTSVKVSFKRFERSGRVKRKAGSFDAIPNGYLAKSLALVLLLLLTFGSFSVLQAQNLASINIPINTDLNQWDRFELAQKLVAETYTITGTVVDEDGLPMGGVNVILKGGNEGTVTDLDGRFEFPRKLEAGETLVFSYLGYDQKEYTVIESESETIDITISFDPSDITLMGAVQVEGVYTSKRGIFRKFFGLFKK